MGIARDPERAERRAADVDNDVAAFLTDLRRLRASAGAPSYARLAKSAGLARSTLHDGLHGSRLPSRELTLGVVRACGGREQTWSHRWTALRQRVEESGRGHLDDQNGGPVRSGDGIDPARTPVAGTPLAVGDAPLDSRRRLVFRCAAALLLLLAAGAGATSAVYATGNDECDIARLYRVDRAGAVLDADAHPMGQVEPGDAVRVRTLMHDRFAHRYYGTVERTNVTGYVDEAKLTFIRQICT